MRHFVRMYWISGFVFGCFILSTFSDEQVVREKLSMPFLLNLQLFI